MIKITFYSAGALLLSFLIYMSLAPVMEIRHTNQRIQMDSIPAKLLPPELSVLNRELAFKHALLELSQEDSMGLIVNLNDSTIGISIHGVLLYYSKINSLSIDPWLITLPDLLYLYKFSRPVLITSHRSTIIKEPIVVREAPKDPVEAAINAYLPDTLIQNPAFLQFDLENNIRVLIEQEMTTSWLDRKTRFAFFNSLFTDNIKVNLKHFITWRGPVYRPEIRISLPADDMRAIYRALPAKTSAIIYLNKAAS
ncbi:MAG: hypothetical protein RJQ14_05125 [Marinoscillum sp.]